jgi:exosortase/archaeosortase
MDSLSQTSLTDSALLKHALHSTRLSQTNALFTAYLYCLFTAYLYSSFLKHALHSTRLSQTNSLFTAYLYCLFDYMSTTCS